MKSCARRAAGPADRAQVEAPVPAARLGHRARAVPLGEHDVAAALRLEQIDVGVHPPRRRRAEAPRRVALRRLGGAGVVDDVVPHVRRHLLARVEALLDLRVRDVAGHDHGAGEREAGPHRVTRELGPELRHRPAEVEPDDVAPKGRLVHLGQEAGGIGLELLEVHAVPRDLPQRLPVGRARHRDPHRAGGAVAREPDHPDVVAEVLPAELGADPEPPRHLVDLRLEGEVPEPPPVLVARGRQAVEVAGGGELGDLQRVLRRGAADHHGEVVGRARRGAERPDLLLQERGEALSGSGGPSSPGRGSSCWPSRRPWP